MDITSVPPTDVQQDGHLLWWTCAECGYGSVDPEEVLHHNCDDEEAAIARGELECIVCECWGTVPGSQRCQGCTEGNDELDDSMALSDTEAMDILQRMFRAPQWRFAADYLERVDQIIHATGRSTAHPHTCDGCGLNHKYRCEAPR